MVKLNKAQRLALARKWQQNSQGMTYRQFRATVQSGFDCVMVRWSGMWLGIEPDGYTHS
jgi:hypothetical protein|tara:strand:+ start:225 stop:401 length:177 start_codon:yes stop_codon:yes gene_type:complete